MRFGERLARERWIPWATHYINFELLKRKIKECKTAADAHDLEEARAEFQRELDAEITKVGSSGAQHIKRLIVHQIMAEL